MIEILYVNPDLIYEEKTFSSTHEALPLLKELMKPDMLAKLLEEENKDIKNKKLKWPCAIIKHEYATLNVFHEDNGFTAMWFMLTPRWKLLKFIKKKYVTKAKNISFQDMPAELNLLNVSSAAEFMMLMQKKCDTH